MDHSATVLLSRLVARGKFRHLQVLLKVAELGSVQRAADAIGLTQSSVTQTVAYLERLIETHLFDRHARGVRPTPACESLLPVVRSVLLGLSETAEVIAARQRRGQRLVRLVASVSASHGLLVGALSDFGKVQPDIAVHLTEAEGDDQLLAIARGEADLVACRRPAVIPEGWLFVPLLEDRFAVLCSAGHPLERIRRPSAELLAGQTWLLFPSGTPARERFDELARSFPNPPLTHTVITRSPTMMTWLLRHEQLLVFMPVNFARPMLEAGELYEVAIGPGRPLQPLGLLRPSALLPEAAEQLGAYLQSRSSSPGQATRSPVPRSFRRRSVRRC